MTWKTMQSEGRTPAPAEQTAQLRDQSSRIRVVRPHDPDPGHVRARVHYSAMLAELLGQK